MNPWNNKGLAFKLTALILSSITLIFSVIFSYNYFFSRRIIAEKIEANALNLTKATVNHIDKVLSNVEKIPENLANFLEITTTLSGRTIFDLLKPVVMDNPEIYGSCIAFEPFAFDSQYQYFAPYVYVADQRAAFTYIPYDYFSWSWYEQPKKLEQGVWSEPYYDEGAGNIIMATYSVPFYMKWNGRREIMGVVTADISLVWLEEIVSSLKIGNKGYGFLLSREGTYITHPRAKLIMNKTIFELAEEENNPELGERARKMISGQSDFVHFQSERTGGGWLSYAPLPSSNWSLGLIFPQEELMADITRLNHMVMFIGLTGFVFLLLVIVFISRSIARPLEILSSAARDITGGNLDIPIPTASSGDEVGKLTESFEYMRRSLKQYILDLTETTAKKERIESELQIAHDIQMGFLPKTFPPFPDRKQFEIFATLVPAKEVGGDLFDFFFVDEDHLCFTVGDVSDKGVPASLYMVITRTLIKTKASQGLSLTQVMNQVNHDLSQDNSMMMFVTIFLGRLNIHSGELEYVNAGHNPPYWIKASGGVIQLEMTSGIALGVDEGFSFESKSLSLKPGDAVFCYTDGVTEAMNQKQDFFSESRLQEALMAVHGQTAKNMIHYVMRQVTTFSASAVQFDDITMLGIAYHGDG